MSTARFIVCEKSSRWAVALRRALGPRGDVLVEVRSLTDCDRQLSQWPASVVALEMAPANLEQLVSVLADWSRRFDEAKFVALCDFQMQPAEPLLREAGAVSVLVSQRQAQSAARLALRHLARSPEPELPWREAVWRRLPWSRWGSASA